MTMASRRAGIAASAAVLAVLAVGCGSTAAHAHGSGPPARVPASSLDTSVATPAGTWAAVVMGGSAAAHNNFWQLLIRPAGTTRWKLVTPPGTADNGGLVIAAGSAQPVITAVRPSQYLTYTPLTQTRDGGQAWMAISPLDAPLADEPDALARQPAGTGMLALLADGTAEATGTASNVWTTLVTEKALADTPAGRSCGLRALTAAAYTPSGVPLLAGTCSRPGGVGIFARSGGTWQAAGPTLPAALAGQPVSVLRLTTATDHIVALLAVGSARAAGLVVAWSAGDGRHWTLSPWLRVGEVGVASASFGPAGSAAVIMKGGRAETIAGAGSSWHPLPAMPAGTATVAPGSAGLMDALAVHGSTLTIWQLSSGDSSWTTAQAINVPIQYGSSG